MNKEEFIIELKKLSININEEQMMLLDKYYQILIDYNQKVNLTSITSQEDVYLKHFYDSLTIVKAIDLKEKLKICDIGSGAGFPGLVLKILFPNLDVVLIDSLNKRVEFLNLVIDELNLKNIVAIHVRGEDYAKIHREEFDLVVSRAVAKLEVLAEICLPLVKVHGYFLAMKANIDDELQNSKLIISKLSAKVEKAISFDLSKSGGHRTLILCQKGKPTNSIYPRDFRIIKKTLKNK